MIFSFALLNLYLHCGFTFDIVEYLLPRLLLNTSDYHNYHHLKVNINYGELGVGWDWLRNTGATFYNKLEFEKTHAKYARRTRFEKERD